jgi:outer membrane protein OmpA-like peptidoglycan-associated protein
MPGYWRKGRRQGARVQATAGVAVVARRQVWPALAACWLMAGCSDPLAAPVDLYHDLEGGEIAAQRPPPPGAGQPYPKLGTVPAKPTMPDPAYRRALQAQLQAERDRTERIAADTPLVVVPPLPSAAPPPQAGQPAGANATLATADAPAVPAKPQAAAPSPVQAAPAAEPGATIPATLTILGAASPGDAAGFPEIPPAPPPPASFEGVPSLPAPTPRIIPVALADTPTGTPVFFPLGSAILPPAQIQALKDVVSHRKHQTIDIIGLGEAASDTPDGQALAIALALKRADAVAHALAGMHVPPSAMQLGARAFGRGVVLRLLP